MHWAEEGLRTEVAISTSATGTNDPLTSTRNAESAHHQAKIQRFWQAIRSKQPSANWLRFVISHECGGEAVAQHLRLRHVAGTAWSTKRYLNIGLLKDQQMRGAITA